MSGDGTLTPLTQETTCTMSTTRRCLEVGKMLFNDAQMHRCLSIYFYTETGRRKPPGAVPPVAAKYLLVFIPPCVTSSDINSGVHAALPGGLQVFLGLPRGCI